VLSTDWQERNKMRKRQAKKIALLQKSAYKYGENILQTNIYVHILSTNN
jgi:hypothetical protein